MKILLKYLYFAFKRNCRIFTMPLGSHLTISGNKRSITGFNVIPNRKFCFGLRFFESVYLPL